MILKNDPLHLILFLCILRLICILLLIFFYSPSELLRYTDFPNYNTCNFLSVNPGFSFIVCILDINDASNLLPVTIAFLLTLLRDYIYIRIAKDYLNANQTVFFIILLALHPYLAVYSLKFSTALFESLFILYLFIFLNRKSNIFNFTNCFIFIIIFLIRNPLFLTLSLILTYYMYENFKAKNSEYFGIATFTLVILFTLFYIYGINYSKIFVSYSSIFSYHSILLLFQNYNFYLKHFFTILATFLSHYFILTGFREAFFTSGFSYFNPLRINFWIEISLGLILVVLHTIGFYGCYKRFYSVNKKILLLVFVVFPAFLVVAHLRYLYSLIPILLLGFATFFFRDPEFNGTLEKKY